MVRLFSLLFFILPFLLFPHTSELFEINKLSLVYLFAGITAFGLSFIRLKFNSYSLALAFFVLVSAISAYFSLDPKTSFWGYYSRFNGGLMSLLSYLIIVLAYQNFGNFKAIKKHINILSITAFILTIIAILEHFNLSVTCMLLVQRPDNSCWSQDVTTRVFATFGQPNWLAAYLAAILPFAFAGFFEANKSKHLVLSFLIFLAIGFTRSRSGLLAVGTAFLVFTLFTFTRTKEKHLKKISILAFMLLLSYLITKPGTLPEQNAFIHVTPSSQIRLLLWRGAWDIFIHNPLVGTGPETFAYAYWKYRPAAHNLTSEWDFTYNKAHNDYLHILATEGLLGFTAYMLTILCALYFLWPKKRDKHFFTKLALFSGYISLLVSQFFGFLTVNTSLLFYLYPAFVAVNKHKPPRKTLSPLTPIMLFLSSFFLFNVFRFWAADVLYKTARSPQNPHKLILAYKLHPEPLYLIKLADCHLQNGLVQKAFYYTNLAVKLSPNNTKVLEMAHDLYLDMGALDQNYTDASAINNKLKSIMPTNAKLFYQEGFMLAQMGQKEQAVEALSQAIYLKPNYEKARILMGLLYDELGENYKANNEYTYVLKNINPNNETAITRLKKNE